jgi:ureidoglycolate lyase
MPMEITPQPLTREAFAPFGDVIDMPTTAGRFYYDDALGNLRRDATASLSVALKAETPDRPLRSELMERHEFSSQTFIPVDVGRWLIVVAPHAAKGGPDMADARAFIADASQGVTYKANTWHHGLTTLDRPGRFAVFMWKAGTRDEEFVPVAPFTVPIP